MSGYDCDICGKDIKNGEIVEVSRKAKVYKNSQDIWDMENSDNVIIEIKCAKCIKEEDL